jgi:hypothetical protein
MSPLPPRATLEALAVRLSAKPPPETDLEVNVGGVSVLVRYVLREAGSSSFKSTEVAVRPGKLPGPGVNLLMDVQEAKQVDPGDVRAGRIRDLVLGDAAFDDAFVVEAGPRDVIQELLDADVRREMLALRPVRLCTTREFVVLLERTDWVDEVEVLERMARLAAHLALRIGPSGEEAVERRRRGAEVAGYRQGPPSREIILAERDADMRALEAQRAKLAQRTKRIALGVTFVVLAGIGAVLAALSHC